MNQINQTMSCHDNKLEQSRNHRNKKENIGNTDLQTKSPGNLNKTPN